MATDQESAEPVQALHAQLRETLMDKIRSGTWGPHTQIPSERELCGHYQVSRTTTRRTISELVHQGRLYTVVGKGTYVAAHPLRQELRPCTGFSEDVQAQGIASTSRVLVADTVPASAPLAESLGEASGSLLYRLRRLRLAAGQPVALQTAHLPASRCPGLLRFDFAETSLFATLRTDYRLQLRRGRTTIKAGLADPLERNLLGLRHPVAVLRTMQTTFLDDGSAIEFCESTFHPDLYQLHLTDWEDRITVDTVT